MGWRNSTERWGGVSQALHWLVVALVVVQIVLANIAEGLPLGMEKLATLARHKSVGITILALMLLRLAWRWANPVPALPAGMSGWQRALARVTHWSFYAILIAMPLSGWAMSSARNFPVSWFGLVQLPDFVAPSESIYRAMVGAHRWLALLLLLVVALHLLAVLYHQFVRRDGLIRRMWPAAVATLLVLGLGAGGEPATATTPAATAAPATAGAPRSFVSDAARSSLRFEFVQAGARTEGRFQRFRVELQLAPDAGDALRVAALRTEIDVASVDSRDAERDGLLRGPDLFDVARHPAARFVVTGAAPRPGIADGLLLRGTLTIRDVSRPVAIPATLRRSTEAGRTILRLDGEIAIRRLEFGVGRGEWKSTEWVADEVRVPFAVVLVPSAGATR